MNKQTIDYPLKDVDEIEADGNFLEDMVKRGSIRVIGEGAPENAFGGLSRPDEFMKKAIEVVDSARTGARPLRG